MPGALFRLRRARQIEAIRPTGISPNLTRIWGVELQGLGADMDALRLPADTSQMQAIQISGGAPYFMLDLDALDGGSALR